MEDFISREHSHETDISGAEIKIRPWYELASPEVREAFFQRNKVLEDFRPKKPEPVLRTAIAKRDQANYPERALWEAVIVMMEDEILRDRLMKQGLATEKREKKIERNEQDWQQYQKIIARYRILVEIADKSSAREYGEREVMTHLHLSDLRIRLADLLANQRFYFPAKEVSIEDRQEAFQRLREAFIAERQEGKMAEVALTGLVRYGVRWLWGGANGHEEYYLRSAAYIERTLPREDNLREKNPGEKIGKFNGFDFIYRVPKEKDVRGMQVKTGIFLERPGHVNLAARTMINAFKRLEESKALSGLRAYELPNPVAYSEYVHAIQDLVTSLPIGVDGKEALDNLLVPVGMERYEKRVSPDQPITFKDVQWMLENNIAFKQVMTLQGAPPALNAANFSHWTSLIRRLRQDQPSLRFWEEWPTAEPKPKKWFVRKNPSKRREGVYESEKAA